GAVLPEGLDGIDLLPYLRNNDTEQPLRPLFWQMGERAALRAGPWKLVTSLQDRKEWELYDLENDTGEQRNLALQHPDKVTKLKAIWQELSNQMGEPIFRYK